MSIRQFLFNGLAGIALWAVVLYAAWTPAPNFASLPQCSIAEFSPDVSLADKQFCRHLRRVK